VLVVITGAGVNEYLKKAAKKKTGRPVAFCAPMFFRAAPGAQKTADALNTSRSLDRSGKTSPRGASASR